jgi:hypothetical protein
VPVRTYRVIFTKAESSGNANNVFNVDEDGYVNNNNANNANGVWPVLCLKAGAAIIGIYQME